jgi:hypothetical protein
MARPTKLDRCCKCTHEARVGVYRAFYSVKAKRKSGVSKQIRRSLHDTVGYCIDHFLELAEKRGMVRVEREALREELEGRVVSRSGRRR